MKHIRFEGSLAGINFSYAPGDVAVWPDDAQAEEFARRGIAEILDPEAAQKAAAASGRPVRTHRPSRKPETAATR